MTSKRWILSGIVVMMILLPAGILADVPPSQPAQAQSGVAYDLVTSWGAQGPPGYLNYARDVAAGPDGNYYVVDTYGRRIQVFTPAGQFVRQWGSLGSGEGQFWRPEGIGLDSAGNVYVADMNTAYIQVFSAAGVFLRRWSTGDRSTPGDVAIGPDGNVYVACYGRIRVFTPSGDPVREWSAALFAPAALAIAGDGTLYVVDWGSNQVLAFASTGELLHQWGGGGSGDGAFYSPEGIAITANGTVLVSDSGNQRVQSFTASGQYLGQWHIVGCPGYESRWSCPAGIAIGTNGDVCVVLGGRLSSGLCHRVQIYSQTGKRLREWGEKGTADGQFDRPTSIALGPQGNVYVADSSNYRLQVFSPAGNYIAKWGSLGAAPGQFNRIEGLAVGPDGNVYVASSRSPDVPADLCHSTGIQVFSPSGGLLRAWEREGSGDGEFGQYLGGIAVARNGNVYVADETHSRIEAFSAMGDYLWQWGQAGSGDDQFNWIMGLAIGPDQNLYVLDYGLKRVSVFTPSGTFLRRWSVAYSYPNSYPDAIAIGPDGLVYIADSGGQCILAFSATGNLLAKWGTRGPAAGQFDSPSGIAVGAQGAIYVTDSLNDRVQLFRQRVESSTPAPSCLRTEVLWQEGFDDAALPLWQRDAAPGTVAISNSILTLAAPGMSDRFPLLWTQPNLAGGEWTLEVRFRYQSPVTAYGSSIGLGSIVYDGSRFTEGSPLPAGIEDILSVHQFAGQFRITLLGQTVWQAVYPDTAWHTLRLRHAPSAYELTLDSQWISSTTQAPSPQSLYLGNPVTQYFPGVWTSLQVDYVRQSRCSLWGSSYTWFPLLRK